MPHTPNQQLIEAAKHGDLLSLQALIKSGVDINTPSPQHILLFEAGCTALHWAARQGESAAVDILLKAGASPMACNEEGNTPLHLAAASGTSQVVQLLVQAGADLQAINHRGHDPVSIAAASGNSDVLVALLGAGAAVNHANHQGDTPLHRAVMHGSLWITQLLIKAGAAYLQKDKAGQDPLARVAWLRQTAHRTDEHPLIWEFLTKLHAFQNQVWQAPLSSLTPTQLIELAHGSGLENPYLVRVLDTPYLALSDPAARERLGAGMVSPLEWSIVNGHFALAACMLTHFTQKKPEYQILGIEKGFSLERNQGFVLRETARYGIVSGGPDPHSPPAQVFRLLLEQGAPAQMAWDWLQTHISLNPGMAPAIQGFLQPLTQALARF